MQQRDNQALFDQVVRPHFRAAYNLARWIMRNEQDAEDVVQDACLRAFRGMDGYHGGDGRAWLLAIVRNTAYTWLRRNRPYEAAVPFDDLQDLPGDFPDPEAHVMRSADRDAIAKALDDLPVEFREIVVLREIEDLSYKEIAHIAGLPIGTVMSRLARARSRLQQSLLQRADKELQRGL